MSNKSNPILQECCFFIGRLCCNTGQCCKKQRAFWDCSHVRASYTFDRDALCQTYCIFWRHIAFSKRDTASEGRLDIGKCTLHSFKGHSVSFEGRLLIWYWYCSWQNTLHCSQGRLHSLRRAFLSRALHLLAGMGRYVAIRLKTPSILRRKCVLLGGHDFFHLR